MIQQIRIQNFRSLKDVTLDLQQVNLLIGPNNSGKTNVMKALKFLGKLLNRSLRLSSDEFERSVFFSEEIEISDKKYNPITFSVVFKFQQFTYYYQVEIHKQNEYLGVIGIIDGDLSGFLNRIKTLKLSFYPNNTLNQFFANYNKITQHNSQEFHQIEFRNSQLSPTGAYDFLRAYFQDIFLYKPNPENFASSYELASVKWLNEDASNIVPFLFSLSQNLKKKFRQLEDDLKRCVGDIVSISTPPDPSENGKLKLKFFDAYDNDYWADEVSEGVLYFLAVLCIIHQPDPPKLLLLEEPEKGIHPRRIREVVDFIFDLAYDKGIQVIATTHDTYVVDQFADIPEAVFVFDKKDGATEVKNLQKDIIKPADQLHTENGLPPTNYTRSLGEHWAAGFLGGVPQ